MGEAEGWDWCSKTPLLLWEGEPVLLDPYLCWSSGMHMSCGWVGLSPTLGGAGRPAEWLLPCAGPAAMTS